MKLPRKPPPNWSRARRIMKKIRPTITKVGSSRVIQTRPLAPCGGLASIRVCCSIGGPSAAFARSVDSDPIDRGLGGEMGDEFRDGLLRRVPGCLYVARLRSSPRTSMPLDREALDVVLLHLVEEPGAVVDRDFVLGCELPEDQPEAERSGRARARGASAPRRCRWACGPGRAAGGFGGGRLSISPRFPKGPVPRCQNREPGHRGPWPSLTIVAETAEKSSEGTVRPEARGLPTANGPSASPGRVRRRGSVRRGSVAGPRRLEPLLAVHGRGAARAGGGDGLAVVGVHHVAAAKTPSTFVAVP